MSGVSDAVHHVLVQTTNSLDIKDPRTFLKTVVAIPLSESVLCRFDRRGDRQAATRASVSFLL
eukprot:3227705-Rhodomonas_salina.2